MCLLCFSRALLLCEAVCVCVCVSLSARFYPGVSFFFLCVRVHTLDVELVSARV